MGAQERDSGGGTTRAAESMTAATFDERVAKATRVERAATHSDMQLADAMEEARRRVPSLRRRQQQEGPYARA
eukprot:5829907-Lingulodinium_polyedra.AAC.1